MSRLPWLFVSLLMFVSTGCMNQPMYQPGYGQPMYGQPMYGPGGYSQPGTLVVPQSNAPAYVPGNTYDSNPNDDFNRTIHRKIRDTLEEKGTAMSRLRKILIRRSRFRRT